MSMALRDGGPFVALGIAAFLPFGGAVPTVLAAAGLMAVTGAAAAVWCCAHWTNLPPATTPRRWCWSWSLWGTSVLGMGVAQVDILIGGAVMDAEALGLYAFLRRIANVVALPVSVATWVSAKPVATAFGAGDMRALRLASADGSRIAWYPACILAALSLAGVTLAAALPWLDVTPMIAGCFVILVAGALMQAFCAAGLTVATLTRYARLAAIARALTLLAYLGTVGVIGSVLSPVSNALAYGVAAVLGSLLVWGVLWRELDVDTSARVLWQQGRAGWKTS
jgi:O-antigen/teichoic acid export membrane protein